MSHVPGVKHWDLEKGREIESYLQNRTRENPWFAGATGALHSGPIDYDRQQPFVEKITDIGPEKLTGEEDARREIKGAQFWKQKSKTVSDLAKCHVDTCSDGQCFEDEDARRQFLACAEDANGIGRKTHDLMAEYLGDKSAVAVDRHVMDWACNSAGVCPVDKVKGDRISDDDYDRVEKAVRKTAEEKGLDASELQVSAWISGVCKSNPNDNVYIGDGLVVECGQRTHKSLDKF